jgi:hypothetical protein
MTDNTLPQRVIEVKSDSGNFLFLYRLKDHAIEIHRRGMVFKIKIQDLEDFGRTSQRNVLRVYPTVIENEGDGGEVVKQIFE